MPRPSYNNDGFSLIELLVVVVVAGILASIALQSMTSTVQDIRRVKTEREMADLAQAIVGDPGLTQNNRRSDFGYVGDVGSFPPNLQALYENPGSYATWDGPYLALGYVQDSTGFKTDEWGQLYAYTGGVTINSSGGGSALTKKVTDATGDYLLNTVKGTILDAANDSPGATYFDSVAIVITYPNGSGGMASKTYQPDASGSFALDSIPVGSHALKIIFVPNIDTLIRVLTVLPRHKSQPSYRFASAYFGGGGGSNSTLTLRPDGSGSATALSSSGCASHYLCVNETIPDDDATFVERPSNSWRTDLYSIDDPASPVGTIDNVVVYCRAKLTKTQGDVMPSVYIGGVEYNGSSQALSSSYAEYQYLWTINPNSGVAWTWTDITNLEAGLRLKGQNASFPARCTQVWVEVTYTN